MLQLSDFRITRKTKSPLFHFKLYKPSVYLFQPIMQKSVLSAKDLPWRFLGDYSKFDSFLAENTIGPYLSGVGKLFRQWTWDVSRIDNKDELVEFDSITGAEAKRLGYLMAQVYDLQLFLKTLNTPVAENRDELLRWSQLQKTLTKLNKAYAAEYRRLASKR